jgi:hypothetical protein
MLSVGPAALPRFVILVLFSLAIVNQVLYVKTKKPGEEKISISKKIILSVVLFGCCGLGLQIFGLILCGSFFLFGEMCLLDQEAVTKNKILRYLMLSVIFTVCVYFIFDFLFKINVPIGILFLR